MRAAATRRSKRKNGFEEQYASALLKYAKRGDEAALGRAYELARGAAVEGKNLIEIASIHHRAVLALIKDVADKKRRAGLLKACGDFLAEFMSPYEMARRGYQDSVEALRRLNETLEEEIKRIAHAVHDEAGQLLVAVHLALAEMSRTLPESRRDQLAQIEKLLNEVEEQLRRYSHELRPTVLDQLGWIPAVRFLAKGVSQRANLQIEVEATAVERLPDRVEIALYRIVQEALNNVARHAKASRVAIKAGRNGSLLSCSIEDDGQGFDVDATRSDRRRTGLGLVGMGERLTAIGGSLVIESSPGRGTKVLIRVPTEQEC